MNNSEGVNLCKNCIYWETYLERQIQGSTIGKCERVKMFWDSTGWVEDSDDRVLKWEHKEDKAFVQDGSDYMAELITLPEFGCNQFKKKIID